jgi:hypothetical protein
VLDIVAVALSLFFPTLNFSAAREKKKNKVEKVNATIRLPWPLEPLNLVFPFSQRSLPQQFLLSLLIPFLSSLQFQNLQGLEPETPEPIRRALATFSSHIYMPASTGTDLSIATSTFLSPLEP